MVFLVNSLQTSVKKSMRTDTAPLIVTKLPSLHNYLPPRLRSMSLRPILGPKVGAKMERLPPSNYSSPVLTMAACIVYRRSGRPTVGAAGGGTA
jgi:hypothetical protein